MTGADRLMLLIIMFFVLLFVLAIIPAVAGFMIWMIYESCRDNQKIKKMQSGQVYPIGSPEWNDKMNSLQKGKKMHNRLLLFAVLGLALLIMLGVFSVVWTSIQLSNNIIG